jgi:transposase
LIEMIIDESDERVTPLARACLRLLVTQLQLVNAQALETDRQIKASARSTEVGRRLLEIPGVGPVLASAIVAAVADPAAFHCGGHLAAWIGLVPRQNSSGGKDRLGGISKQGHRYLR